MILKIFTSGISLLFFISCSSSDQTTEEESGENEVYVFDEVPIDDSPTIDAGESKEIERNYVIQIGAFSSKENADKFAEDSKIILSEDVNVDYNERTNFYVITLSRIFKSRNEAINRRNELWTFNQYRDAWLREVK